MRIFGINITREKPPVEIVSTEDSGILHNISDQPVSVEKVQIPGGKVPALIPSVKSTAYTYMADRAYGRGVFECPEYDLALIGRIEDTEAYVRQAFKKKTGLMFKEGYEFVGPDKQTVRYIKIRLNQIAMATNIPTAALIRAIGSSLIKKSNAFVLKVRNTDASGGRVRKTPDGKELKPIAGYFILPAEMMEVDSDALGNIRKWRQRTPSGLYNDFNPQDVIHFKFDAKDGFIYGTPTLVPVVDDIRALRKIEENIELLVYQHLFPLFHYKVGTETAPAGITETGEREIDVVKREIQFMPSEGGIVTPERHEISMVGAESRALRAEGYLMHFKKRVFAGLGVSAVDMGEGETANRSTADNMSRALIDDVKDFQDILETQFNQFIIKELLLESTLGDDVLNEERLVFLKFHEIDIDKRIKVEAHAADQFSKHAITLTELREAQGREAIAIPQTTDEDDPIKYPDWHETFWKLIEEPKALIQAIDEPFTPAAHAAAANKNTSVTPANVQTAGEQKVAAEKAIAKAKPVAKVKNSVEDHLLSTLYSDVEENISYNIQHDSKFDKHYAAVVVHAQATKMVDTLITSAMAEFIKGYTSTSNRNISVDSMASARIAIRDRANKYITRLSDSLISALDRQVDNPSANDKISLVRSVFSSFKYRTDLIVDVELRKANNYGRVMAMKDLGQTQVTFGSKDSACDRCKAADGTVNIKDITFEDVPPFHGDCNCLIIQKKEV